MPVPFQVGGAQVDLSERIFQTATVAASPAAATETIIASLNVNRDLAVAEGVLLAGYAAFTVGASGTSANLKIRRTDASGSTVKASGLVNVTAAALYDRAIVAFDAGTALPASVYVLTLTVTAGAAESTVSAVSLVALVV